MECKVCGLPAHGNHFGVASCRACAAFFRRALTKPTHTTRCRMQNDCQIWKTKLASCRKCRLDRCREVGMDPSKSRLDQDPQKTIASLPKTVEQFLGRAHFFLFTEPSSETPHTDTFIDCHSIIDQASKLLRLGSASPISARNSLEKLTMGLQMARKQQMAGSKMQVIRKFGGKEMIYICEQDFLTVTRWLTYFDDFQLLPHNQQMEILKALWNVWGRMDKLALTASKRRQNVCVDKIIMFGQDTAIDVTKVESDLIWLVRYKPEQLQYFLDTLENWMMADVVEAMCRLEPSEVEMTYLMCQLCFDHAGKQLQGELLKVTDRFEDTLASNLHDYYVNELKMPNYSGRLVQIININRLIQKHIIEKQAKNRLGESLGIWRLKYSHPEMFVGGRV